MIRAASPAGNLDEGRVVQERQGLERRVGTETARAGLDASGSIESRQEGVRRGPPEERIEPPAIAVGAGVGLPRPPHLTQVHHAVGLRRKDARTAHDAREQAAARQGGVADQFGVEAQPSLPPEQSIVGIDRLTRRDVPSRPGGRSPSTRSGDGSPCWLQSRSMNSQASQSSSSGWLGGVPCVPKSLSVSTRPRPKYACQIRFTATLAVSGLRRSTSQRARSMRSGGVPGLESSRRGKTAGTPGRTCSPLRVKSPPMMDVRGSRLA